MNEIISFIGCLLIGFYLGWRLRELYARAVVDKYLKDLDTSTSNNSISLSVHKEKDQYYITKADTGQFLVQVTNKNELFDYINKSFGDKIVFIKPDQLALFD